MDYGNSPVRSSSSFGSDDDFPRSLSHLRIAANGTPVASSVCDSRASTPSPTSSPCPTPLPPLVPEVAEARHEKNRSLSKTWTFPRGGGKNAPPAVEEVDHFFGCLADIEDSPIQRSGATIDSRDLFSQRLQFCASDDDSFPPFVLPAQKVSVADGLLASVTEEDEVDDRDDCDTPDGKTLTFPVSVSQDSLCDTKLPVFEDDSPSESVPFVFPQMKKAMLTPSPRSTIAKPSRDVAPASMIPISRSAQAQSSPSLPRTTTPQSSLPSRIPPPSPPTFITAKPPMRTLATPSPPKRKPAPSPLSPINTTPNKLTRNPMLSTRGIGQSSPQSGSTFIPQLKLSSTLTHFAQ